MIILFLFIFFMLKASTFGWRFLGKAFNKNEVNLALIEELKNHVYILSQEIGDRSFYNYGKLERAKEYISQQFESFGYDNLQYQDYTVSLKPVSNIIVFKKGSERPEEIIIVGAHYDTCGNPGADDNASAVAGLLALARFFADRHPARSIRFVAFVNEEPPFFKTEEMGSRVYAKAIKAKQENIKAAIILESIGFYSSRPHSQRYPLFFGPFYPNRGNFITVVGNFASRWLVNNVVSDFKKETGFPIESTVSFNFVPGIDFSDHWSFWQDGYPAVMITDTAFYRNPHYHLSSDTYEKLDYESLAQVVRGVDRALVELSK